MFSKTIALFFLAFFSVLVAAAPNDVTTTITVTATPTATTISQCNTGNASCCNVVGAASSLPGLALLTGLLGIVLQDLSVVVGLACTPLTVIGVGQGANCAQQPVCCTNNQFNGLINIGCTPISL